MEVARKICTCTDLKCPLHPANHDKGCTPCISKNLKDGEIPSCFFKAVDANDKPNGYTMRDFAEYFNKKNK